MQYFTWDIAIDFVKIPLQKRHWTVSSEGCFCKSWVLNVPLNVIKVQNRTVWWVQLYKSAVVKSSFHIMVMGVTIKMLFSIGLLLF